MNKNTLKLMRLCEDHGLDLIASYSGKSGVREDSWSLHKDYRLLGHVSEKELESLTDGELENIVYSASIQSLWS